MITDQYIKRVACISILFFSIPNLGFLTAQKDLFQKRWIGSFLVASILCNCLVSNDTALNMTTPHKLASYHRDCVDTSVMASCIAKNSTAIRTAWVSSTNPILCSKSPLCMFGLQKSSESVLNTKSSVTFWSRLACSGTSWLVVESFRTLTAPSYLTWSCDWPNLSYVWNFLVADLDGTSPWNSMAHTGSGAIPYKLKDLLCRGFI